MRILSSLVALATAVVLFAFAVPADAAVTGYQHTDELNFHPSPDRRGGSQLPVLVPEQHCSGIYVARYFAYFNGRVLVCG